MVRQPLGHDMEEKEVTRRSGHLQGDDPLFQAADPSELTKRKPKSNDSPPVQVINLNQVESKEKNLENEKKKQ